MKNIDNFTKVYEAATIEWKWGGFTPKTQYYIWLWSEQIQEILDNAVPTNVNTDFDNHDNEVWSWILRIEKQIENIKTPENLISFIKNNEWNILNENLYNTLLFQLKEKLPDLSYLSFTEIFSTLFNNELVIKASETHFSEQLSLGKWNICIFWTYWELLDKPEIIENEEIIFLEDKWIY